MAFAGTLDESGGWASGNAGDADAANEARPIDNAEGGKNSEDNGGNSCESADDDAGDGAAGEFLLGWGWRWG